MNLRLIRGLALAAALAPFSPARAEDEPPAPEEAAPEEVRIPVFPPRPKSPPDASAEAIARDVAALGSEAAEARAAASDRLFWIGEPARAALEGALRSADPEVASQARRVLDLLDARKALTPVNVKFKVRGYVLVGSKTEDPDAPGGFYNSPNLPAPVPEDLKALPGLVSIVAAPDEVAVFGRRHLGFPVRIVNLTKEDLAVDASDSRIPVVMQAKNGRGEWVDLEYLPQSW